MKYDIACIEMEKEAQREAVILLGKVFPDYWEQIAAKDQEFPFDEISAIYDSILPKKKRGASFRSFVTSRQFPD